MAAARRVRQIVTEYPAFRLPAATLQALKANPTDPVALAEAQRLLGPNYLSELIALTHGAAIRPFFTWRSGGRSSPRP